MIDEGRLNQLIGQMVSDLGGASSVAMVRIGDALGLYKALHANGAMTAAELGSSVGAHERYVREWLSNQAASNYLTYDPATRKFSLSGEQAMVFAVDDSPVYMLGGFDLLAAMLATSPRSRSSIDWRTMRKPTSWRLSAACGVSPNIPSLRWSG